jgi:hypothetical protein
VKASLVAGFIHHSQFYTRAEAARLVAERLPCSQSGSGTLAVPAFAQ